MASDDAPDDDARAASIDDRQVEESVTARFLAHCASAPGSSERLFAAIYPELVGWRDV